MFRLNREELGALSKDSQDAVLELHQTRLKNPGKAVIGSWDFVPEMDILYEAEVPSVGKEKIFYLTDKTIGRARNMNCNAFLGPNNEAVKMTFTKDEVGYLVWRPNTGYWKMCSAVYCIKDKKLYMKVFADDYMAGYIIPDSTDGDKIALIPYSAFSMVTVQHTPAPEHKGTWGRLLEMILEDFPDGFRSDFFYKLTKTKKFAKMKTHDMIEDHLIFANYLSDALQALIFLKTCEVYSMDYVTDNTPTFRRKKGYRPLNYIQVDTTWDRDIDVNNPFPVRGHFVHQPCKVDGKWTHKLIYVEQYMKKGYHRRAKKTIEESNE